MKKRFTLAIFVLVGFVSCQNAEDIYKEGLSYYYGSDSKKQNTEKGISLLQKAANKGYPMADYKLGEISIERGNLHDGMAWFDKYIEVKKDSSALKIADSFFTGTSVFPQNDSCALKYYKKAFELDKADSDAYNNVGVMYVQGRGVGVDYGKAYDYFKRAADMNDPYGLYNLAICYYNGTGAELNQDIAKSYFQKAADLGHVKAQEVIEDFRQQEEWAREQEYYRQQQLQRERQEAIDSQVITCPGCAGRGIVRGTGFHSGGTQRCDYCGGGGVITYGKAKMYGLI